MRPILSLAIILCAGPSAATPALSGRSSDTEIVERSKISFVPLNPLRGDMSPRAGKLWGDLRDTPASGMLVTFVDGFQSPPHIHNITYRAVVIDGFVHNDDPTAAKMWMGPGSFWTQPAGENHITAAKGKTATIFLEILSGPYLVQPAEQAFDTGERPINIDARNVVWLSAADTTWIKEQNDQGPQLAHLWGQTTGGAKTGTFVKLPAGYQGALDTRDASLTRAVTIKGVTTIQLPGETKKRRLDPGSYVGSKGSKTYQLACVSKDDCIIYFHTDGRFEISPL